MEIRPDDPRSEEVNPLLREHLLELARVTPPESMHALDIDALCAPEITFWTAWEGGTLLGCGALQQLNDRHGEIKSMRTATEWLRQGVGSGILRHLIGEAESRGYTKLSLETGAQAHFAPARAFYAGFGFQECGPFAGYAPDPNSVFMTLTL